MSINTRHFAYISWANAAPTLTDGGTTVAAPTNPAAGEIQVVMNAPYSPKVVLGSAGPGSWKVTPLNATGLVKVVDDTGAAVAFGSTTGFVVLQIYA